MCFSIVTLIITDCLKCLNQIGKLFKHQTSETFTVKRKVKEEKLHSDNFFEPFLPVSAIFSTESVSLLSCLDLEREMLFWYFVHHFYQLLLVRSSHNQYPKNLEMPG